MLYFKCYIHWILVDVTQVLCELELIIRRVKVSTTPEGRVMDLFFITDTRSEFFSPYYFVFFFVWISRRILRNLRLLLTYFEWLSWLFICGKTWKFKGKDENVRLYVYCYYHIMCPYCIAIMNGETIWRKIITDSKHG